MALCSKRGPIPFVRPIQPSSAQICLNVDVIPLFEDVAILAPNSAAAVPSTTVPIISFFIWVTSLVLTDNGGISKGETSSKGVLFPLDRIFYNCTELSNIGLLLPTEEEPYALVSNL